MDTPAAALPVTVNGERRDLPADATLPDVLCQMDLDPETAPGVAVAVNDEVVPRARWGEKTLGAGDRVEVITAQQGG